MPDFPSVPDISGVPGAGGRVTANLAALVTAAAAANPNGAALVAGTRRWTWAELAADVEALAAALQARDLRFGDRVALRLGNGADFVLLYLAALRAGLVVAPLDPAAPAADLAGALADTGARLLVTDHPDHEDADQEDAAGRPAGVDVLRADPDVAALLAAGAALPSIPGPGPGGEVLAALLQTAGTGGRPKRAMLSHRALLANLDQCARLDPAPVRPGDVVLLALPLFHVFGLNAVLGQALFAGATTVLALDPDPDAVLALVAEVGVTSVAGTPAMYAAWAGSGAARTALAQVRVLVSGSAPLRPAEAAAFRAATGRRVWQGYGLTEAAPVVSAALRAKEGSVGHPIPGLAVRIVDVDGSVVATGDAGELEVRGPNLFSGYWPDGLDGPGPDGWFPTGDVAYADADGDLFMVSTRHDVVVVAGFAVYPREVEDVLLGAPGVAEAAVVGVAVEDGGPGLKAFLVPAPGAAPTAADVRAHCGARLARFKVPTAFELVSELPRSVAGKIARSRLR